MKIKYSKRETKNLGNYENVTVEISVEDIVDVSIETKEECFVRLKKFVIDRLSKEFNKEPINIEETKIDIEEVKNKIVSLIDKDKNNRKVIKSIFAIYKATKLQELSEYQLEEVNKKLNSL